MRTWQLVVWPSRDAAGVMVYPERFVMRSAHGPLVITSAQTAGVFSPRKRWSVAGAVALEAWNQNRAHAADTSSADGEASWTPTPRAKRRAGPLSAELTRLPPDWQSRSSRWQ